MPIITFIRHAETVYNANNFFSGRIDCELSEKGIQETLKRFHYKNTEDNKYVFLFAKTSILKQRDKYRYGYKFNETRMKKQQIMLPVNEKGEPDYKFMEDYMKYCEQKKLLEYLDYIK